MIQSGFTKQGYVTSVIGSWWRWSLLLVTKVGGGVGMFVGYMSLCITMMCPPSCGCYEGEVSLFATTCVGFDSWGDYGGCLSMYLS